MNYLVCATPRSGSSLLCAALAATGVAGWPFEYFQEPVMRKCCAGWGIAPPADAVEYLRLLSERTRTGNGVFGAKLMYGNLASLLQRLPPDQVLGGNLLPGLRFVRIVRRDAVRQAISVLRASQTEHWSSEQAANQPARAEPSYDFAQLEERLSRIARQTAKWDRFFAGLPEPPALVCYEELSADVEGNIRRVLACLGIEPGEPLFPRPLTLRRQSDALNEEWLARYRRDKGDCGSRAVCDLLPANRG